MAVHQIFELGDFQLQKGSVLPDAKLGYLTLGELNEARDNVVVSPTWFTAAARRRRVLADRARARAGPVEVLHRHPEPLRRRRLVLAEQHAAAVRADALPADDGLRQRRRPAAPADRGARRGADQARRRLVHGRLPGLRVGRAVPGHGRGARADQRQRADRELQQGLPPGQHPGDRERRRPGPRASTTAPRSPGSRRWPRSTPAGRSPSPSTARSSSGSSGRGPATSSSRYFWDAFYLKNDANDLLSQFDTWFHNDLGDHPNFGGDFDAALGAITARTIIIQAETDRYFPPVDSDYEASKIPNARVQRIDTDWGHMAPFNPDDQVVIDAALRDLLGE